MMMVALGGGLAAWSAILLLLGWPQMAALAVAVALTVFLLGTIDA